VTVSQILKGVRDFLGASWAVAGCRFTDGRRCVARCPIGGAGQQPGTVVAAVQLGGELALDNSSVKRGDRLEHSVAVRVEAIELAKTVLQT
jgi:hypothetical protein